MDLEPEQRQALGSAHSIRSAIPIGRGLSGDSSTPRSAGDLVVTRPWPRPSGPWDQGSPLPADPLRIFPGGLIIRSGYCR